MEPRLLGDTGLKISPIGLGGHLFPQNQVKYYPGFYGRRIVEDECFETRLETIEAALASGINLLAVDFDYEASALGRALKQLKARDRVVLTGVIDFRFQPGQPADLSKLEWEIDRILELLDTDLLELPQIRVADWYLTDGLIYDLLEELDRIKAKNKIVCPAFYSGDLDESILVNGLEEGWFKLVMRALGLLNPMACQKILPLVAKNKAGFIGFLPFQKGWLFDCGREAGLTGQEIAQAGLGWILKQQGVTATLCGVSGPEEVYRNAEAARSGCPGSYLSTALRRIISTDSYCRFLDQMELMAPNLVMDWRKVAYY